MPPRGAGGPANKRKRTAASPEPGSSTSKRSKATSAPKKASKSSAAAASSSKGKGRDIESDPVFKQGKAKDLLKEYDPTALLGIEEDDRLSPVSSDEAEGLAGWTAKDEDRWRTTLVQAQDETSDQSFIIDELLRWREHPRRPGVYQYRVAWQTYPIYACTWEPASSFDPITLEEFWARKKGRPDYIPLPGPDDEEEDISAHDSDTDFASFHHLSKDEVKLKIQKMRRAWRQDKCDLRLVKSLRREERDHRKRIALQTKTPVSSSSTSHAASPTAENSGDQRWITTPQMRGEDVDDDVTEQPKPPMSAGASQAESLRKQASRTPKAAAVGTFSKKAAPSTQSGAAAKRSKANAAGAQKSATSSNKGSESEIVTIVISSDEDEEEETGASSGPSKPTTPNAKKVTPAKASNAKANTASPAASSKKSALARKGAAAARASSAGEDPSDGDVEDEGEDDDVTVGQQTQAAAPSSGSRRATRDSDSDFFDRSRSTQPTGGRRQIIIPTRADASGSSGTPSTSAQAASKPPVKAAGLVVGVAVGGAPAKKRLGSSSSSPLTSLPPSDSELSVLAAVRAEGAAAAAAAADERPRKKVRIAETGALANSPTSTPAGGSGSISALPQSPSEAARRTYEPMPVSGTVPQHHTLTAEEIAEGERSGKRQTSLLAKKKLVEHAIASKAAEIAEREEEEEDESLWGDPAGVATSLAVQAAPAVAVRSTAALIPRTADGVPITMARARAAGASSGTQSSLTGLGSNAAPWDRAGANYKARREAEWLREAEQRQKARASDAAKSLVTRPPEENRSRQAKNASPSKEGASVSPVRQAAAGPASSDVRVTGVRVATSRSTSGKGSTSTPPVKGSYKGAHRAGPKIQRIGLIPDPIPKSKLAAARAKAAATARPSTSLADLPTIPRKPPPSPAEKAKATQETVAHTPAATILGPANTSTNDDLADLWGDDAMGPGDFSNSSQPNGHVSGHADPAPAPPINLASDAAAQMDLFHNTASGWDADEPPAQPIVAPNVTNIWASEAAAQKSAFDDAAAAWGDPEPPAQPPVAPTVLTTLNGPNAPVHGGAQTAQMGLGHSDQRSNAQSTAQWNANGPTGALPQSQHTSAPEASPSTIDVGNIATQERERFEEAALGWGDEEPPARPTAPAPPPVLAPAPNHAQTQPFQQPYAQQRQHASTASNGYQTPATADAWLGSGPPQSSQLGTPQATGMSNSAITSWQAVIPLGATPSAATPVVQQPNQPGGATPHSTGPASVIQQAGGGGGLLPGQTLHTIDEERKRFEEAASAWGMEEPPERVEAAPAPPQPQPQQPNVPPSITQSRPYHPPLPPLGSQYPSAQAPNAAATGTLTSNQDAIGGLASNTPNVADSAERQRFEEIAAGWDDEEPPNHSAKAAPAPPPFSQAPAAPAVPDAPPFGGQDAQAGPSPSAINWGANLASAWDGVRAPPPRLSYPPRERNGSTNEGDGSWGRRGGRNDRFRDQGHRRDYGDRDDNRNRGYGNLRDSGNSYGQGGSSGTWDRAENRRDSGGYRGRGDERPAWGNPDSYADQSRAQPRDSAIGAHEPWSQARNPESAPSDSAVASFGVNTDASQPAATSSAAPALPPPVADNAPEDAERKKFEEIAAGWDDDLPPSPPRRSAPIGALAPASQSSGPLPDRRDQPNDLGSSTVHIPTGPRQGPRDSAAQSGHGGPGPNSGLADRGSPFGSAPHRNSRRDTSPDPASVQWFQPPGPGFVHPDRAKRRATELDNIPADTLNLVYDDDNDGESQQEAEPPRLTGTNQAPLTKNRWGRTATVPAPAPPNPNTRTSEVGTTAAETAPGPPLVANQPGATAAALAELPIDPRRLSSNRAYEEYDAVVPSGGTPLASQLTVPALEPAAASSSSLPPPPLGATASELSGGDGQATDVEAATVPLTSTEAGEATLELSEDEEGEVGSDDAAMEIFGWSEFGEAAPGTTNTEAGAESLVAETAPTLHPAPLNVQADEGGSDSDMDEVDTVRRIQVIRKLTVPNGTMTTSSEAVVTAAATAAASSPPEEESQTVRASSSDPVHMEQEKGGGDDGPQKLSLSCLDDTDDSEEGEGEQRDGPGSIGSEAQRAVVGPPTEYSTPVAVSLGKFGAEFDMGSGAQAQAEAEAEGEADGEGEEDDDDALAVEALVN
ncbi:hypothetical protein OC846_001808 [Tilletia horrida]|uniref:Chromo domain-containing protein n=1 Tax=Tilletia horrida TaxID=155126 RepID=A0AAN6GSZ4_9BASI|nr:hypothetical protein OC846_001808 [Tilletia horrida]KAK0568396.1 hypothetical protein OC861_001953 [Tilletia horrida]